ncbi:MAG: histidine kinase, partial [Brevundimonas sp.]
MSRALDLSNEAVGAAPTVKARPAQVGLFANPLIPMLTTLGVTMLVVLALLFARTTGMVAALWGASGLAAVVWLRCGQRGLIYEAPFALLIATGVMAGELMAGNPIGLSVAFTAANMLEVMLVVAGARKLVPQLRLDSVDNAARYLLIVSGLAPIPSALLMSGTLAGLHGQPFFEAFATWWFSHALGFVVLGALGLSATPQAVRAFARPARAIEAIGILGVILAVSVTIYSGVRVPVGFVMLPLLLLTAVRLKVLGTSVALGVISLAAIGSAMLGHGPYTTGFTGPQQAMMAQLLVIVGYLPLLFVAALLEERDAFADRARDGQLRAEQASEAKSRLLANVAHEIKSPVGGVIGIGDLWRTGQLGPVTATQTEMAEMLVKT